jgi:hypothetical protein
MHELAHHDKEQRLHFATWARHKEGIFHNMWWGSFPYGWNFQQEKCSILGCCKVITNVQICLEE